MRKTMMFMAVLLVVVSCQKDLCYDHTHTNMVEVAFSWDRVDSTLASMMDVTMVSLEGVSMSHHFNNSVGGVVESPSPTFRSFCYNTDSDINKFTVTNWDSASVTTSETDLIVRSLFGNTTKSVPRGGSMEETVRNQPTLLLADTCSMFNVKDRLLTFHPQDILMYVDVVAEGVDNIGDVQSVSGAISGMSSMMSLSRLVASDDACTLPFSMEVTGDAIKGNIMSFGHCTRNTNKHILTLYVMLRNGAKVYYNFDVTSQMHKSAGSKHIRINIEGLKIPNVKADGFNPEIDTWNEIKETIEL